MGGTQYTQAEYLRALYEHGAVPRIDWALVQREVSRLTQFCSYDRTGYAWSDSGPTRDVVAQTTDDLHLLLRTAGIRPP